MRTLPMALTSGHMVRASGTTLSVVAVYDGITDAVGVHAAIGALTMSAGPDVNVRCITWSFDMLTRLDVRHVSIREAAQADVLIVSASGTDPLLAHVTAWVTTCLRENGRGAPLLAALHLEAPGLAESSSPLCEFLSRTAALWQTEFLCNEDFAARLDQGLALQLLERRNRRFELDPDDAGHPELAGFRWGIND